MDQNEKEEKIITQVKHQIKYRYDTDSDDGPYLTKENKHFSTLSKHKKA